jgi:hypothetical protein
MSTTVVSQALFSSQSTLILCPDLAVILGRTEAEILQQIHYWLGKSKNVIDGIRWVYNTYQQWQSQFPFLSERTIRRAVRHLEDLGILKSDRKEASRWYQRKWYTIDYEALDALVSSKLPNSSADHAASEPSPLNPPDVSETNNQIHAAKKDASYTKTSSKSFKETNTNPSTHPVLKKIDSERQVPKPVRVPKSSEPQIQDVEPKSNPETADRPEIVEATIAPEIEAQVKEAIAPVPLNQQIKKSLLQATTEAILEAVKVVKQQKQKKYINNPAGLFRSALQNLWKPNPPEEKSVLPGFRNDFEQQEFNEWFRLAQQAGLVMSSTVIDGRVCVFTPDTKCHDYEEYRSAFTLPWIKRRLAEMTSLDHGLPLKSSFPDGDSGSYTTCSGHSGMH